MEWYAAHVVMYVEFKDGRQDCYPLWENIILIEAETAEAAQELAEERAREDEGDSEGSFFHDDRPARWVFGGVRKLVLCVDADQRPGHGTEVTYSEMELPDKETFDRFVEGETVDVKEYT